MEKLLLRLAYWIFRRYGRGPNDQTMMLPDAVVSALPAARALCDLQDLRSASGTSGEFKRRQVYSRLMRDYPRMDRRLISLCIEVVMLERVIEDRFAKRSA